MADPVADGVDDQRGNADRGSDMAHVDLEAHPHEGLGGPWTRRLGEHRVPPLSEALVSAPARQNVPDAFSGVSPALGHLRHERLEALPRVLAPRPVLGRLLLY